MGLKVDSAKRDDGERVYSIKFATVRTARPVSA
jgi:hypothetical protein